MTVGESKSLNIYTVLFFFFSSILLVGIVLSLLSKSIKLLSGDSGRIIFFFLTFALTSVLSFYSANPPQFLVSKCSLCGKKASDKLLYLAKEKKHCREHLLEEFRKGFLAYKNKAVVFYPDINKSVNSYQYWFILKSGFDSLKSNNKEIDINVRTLLEKSLDLIAGPCQKCSKPAQVAYFGKNTFKWSEGSWPKPLIENILVKPEILCVECVLDKIEPPLRSYKGKFTEGICVPEKEDGALLMIII